MFNLKYSFCFIIAASVSLLGCLGKRNNIQHKNCDQLLLISHCRSISTIICYALGFREVFMIIYTILKLLFCCCFLFLITAFCIWKREKEIGRETERKKEIEREREKERKREREREREKERERERERE